MYAHPHTQKNRYKKTAHFCNLHVTPNERKKTFAHFCNLHVTQECERERKKKELRQFKPDRLPFEKKLSIICILTIF
jgi:hypothetical protein